MVVGSGDISDIVFYGFKDFMGMFNVISFGIVVNENIVNVSCWLYIIFKYFSVSFF